MTAYLAPQFDTQFFDGSNVAAGYKLYTYESGTTTPKAVYSDQAGTVPHTNPIVLDANGRVTGQMFLGSGEYTFTLKTDSDVLVKTWNDVAGSGTANDAVAYDSGIRSDLANTSGSSLIGYLPPISGAIPSTAKKKLDSLAVDLVADFGADPTGATDISTAYQNAINSGASVITAPPWAVFKISNSITLASGQTHSMWGVTFNGSSDMLTWSAHVSNLNYFGGTFNATAANVRAFGASSTSIVLNGCVLRGISFNQTLTKCLDGAMILCRVEDNFFGTPGGTRATTHLHINSVANPASGWAVNCNLFKGNRFLNATAATPSTFIQFGTGNTFLENDWENGDGIPLRIDGGGVTTLEGNWFEGNSGAYQAYFECSGAITNSLYYNRVVNARGNTFNMVSVGNSAALYLDANSLNLAMRGNSLYSNQAGAKVTVASTGTNGGVVRYQDNSNYGASVSEADISSITNLYAGFNGFNVLDRSSGANLFNVQTGGQIQTGTSASSPYNSTTASAANLVVLSNGVLQRSTSARKYKNDIRPLERIQLNKLQAVRYKSLCQGDDPNKDHFGFIADDADSAGLHELVSYGSDGQVEGFQYERATAVLWNELQSLRDEFDAFKASKT